MLIIPGARNKTKCALYPANTKSSHRMKTTGTRRYHAIALLMGVNCFIVQLVLIREFLGLFSGNELVIGILLAFWMLLTAVGAWAGKRLYRRGRAAGQLTFILVMNGLFPLAGAIFAVFLHAQFFTAGEMESLQGILLVSLGGLGAFCLVSGMLYTLLAAALSELKGSNSISRIYALEAVGSLAGGLLFNFFLVYHLNGLRILSLLFLLNLLAAAGFALAGRHRLQGGLLALLTLAAGLPLLSIDPDVRVAQILYPQQEVVASRDTPFGKLVITAYGGSHHLYSNGKPLDLNTALPSIEERVHFPMALHPSPRDVLILAGGWDATAAEVLKYPGTRVDYIARDPWMLEAAARIMEIPLPEEVGIGITDPVRFLQSAKKQYDVIIMSLGAPATVADNRFYTDEFFKKIDKALRPGGIFSLGLPPAGNYLDDNARMLYSTVYQTLQNNFTHLRIIPGLQTWFLAAALPLQGDITMLLEEKGISAVYVNKYYLDDRQMGQRAGMILEGLDREAKINRDFSPLAAYMSIRQWLGMLGIPLWPVALVPLLLMLIFVPWLKPVDLGLFTGGFTAASVEFVMLIAFQVVYGYIYQMAGLIIMAFMAGLAFGAGILHKVSAKEKKQYVQILFLLAALAGLLPFAVTGLTWQGLPGWMPAVMIVMLTFLTASLTGLQYKIATVLRKSSIPSTASATYGADLAGSAFGVFLTAVFIFPVLGMTATGFLLAGMNLLTAIIIFYRLKT
jgi:spermidine synthase